MSGWKRNVRQIFFGVPGDCNTSSRQTKPRGPQSSSKELEWIPVFLEMMQNLSYAVLYCAVVVAVWIKGISKIPAMLMGIAVVTYLGFVVLDAWYKFGKLNKAGSEATGLWQKLAIALVIGSLVTGLPLLLLSSLGFTLKGFLSG